MAISHVASTIIATAEPGSANATVSCLHDFGAGRVDGLWVYTTINASGFRTTPGNGYPAIRVSVLPQASSGAGAATAGPPEIDFVNPTPTDAGYAFANYWPGQPPRYATVRVQNLTDVDVATDALSVAVEYVKET